MSLTSMLPKEWRSIVIDLKNCFITIPPKGQDREKSALTVLTYNNSQLVKRYQWKGLPWGNVKLPHPMQIFCAKTIGNSSDTISKIYTLSLYE